MNRGLLGIAVLLVGLAACRSKDSPDQSSTSAADSANADTPMDPAAAGVEGFRLYDKDPRDEAGAVRQWESSCTQGDTTGCTGLGIAFMLGLGGKSKDYAKALELLAPACTEKKVLRACSALGRIYFFGWGVPKDVDQGRALWQRACDGQEPRGCYLLGLAYTANDGPPAWRDPEAGLMLFKRACTGGHREACNEVRHFEEVARQEATARRLEEVKKKIEVKWWDGVGERSGVCLGKGLPPYQKVYDGGTFKENETVAEAEGCKHAAFVSDDERIPKGVEANLFCCPYSRKSE